MAAVSLPKSIDWTIESLQTEKNSQRGAWTEEFHKNKDLVATTIATSIAQEMFGKLQEWLGDPYRPIPVSSDVLILNYSLFLPDNTSKIKQWMQDTAKLQPFASWFEQFEQRTPVEKEVDMKSFSIRKIHSSPIDTRFFQSLMTLVGQQVASCLDKTIEEFRKNPANVSLQSKIEWCREGEQPSMSSSGWRRDNVVSISLWLQTQQSPNKSFWGSWV